VFASVRLPLPQKDAKLAWRAKRRGGEGDMAKRVLVLDEDAAFRRELERELRKLGHEPAAFSRWAEALDYVEQAAMLDSLATELVLGHGPNGVSFARMARRRRPELGVVFMTREHELAAKVDPRLGPVFLKGDGALPIAEALQGFSA
jgi:CheY-like chemotaxis protein